MICVQNIYYMLSYAFQVLNEQGYKQVLTEEFKNAADLCAAILIKGVSSQVKRGLDREYLSASDCMTTIRGRIDINSTINSQSLIKRQLVCNYDEFSKNSYLNRIIKTTMVLLMRHPNVDKQRRKELRKLSLYFADVERMDVSHINWQMRFNRNNQMYRMLISVCYLVINGLLQTKSNGQTKMMDFLDTQKMSHLYEKFILEYYKKEHGELHVSSSQIPWNLDDDENDMLPIMQSDIMLNGNDKTLIIDAKYYKTSTQSRYDSATIRSAHLYQIYSYVKNYDKDRTGNVLGMLLYAKTDEETPPNGTYGMDGNKIMVRTLDLNCDFAEIRRQLDDIAMMVTGASSV